MSAVVLEDFYKSFFGNNLTDKYAKILMKAVVLITGAISLGELKIHKKIYHKIYKNFKNSIIFQHWYLSSKKWGLSCN